MESRKPIGMELRALNSLILRKKGEWCPDIKPKTPVTMMHARIIAYLFMNKDRDIFQKDIEQEFEIRRPTVTKLLQSMEKNGLITRHEADHDARLKKISLTEMAVLLHEQMLGRINSFEKVLTRGLTDEEITAFLITVEKIKKNLEQ